MYTVSPGRILTNYFIRYTERAGHWRVQHQAHQSSCDRSTHHLAWTARSIGWPCPCALEIGASRVVDVGSGHVSRGIRETRNAGTWDKSQKSEHGTICGIVSSTTPSADPRADDGRCGQQVFRQFLFSMSPDPAPITVSRQRWLTEARRRRAKTRRVVNDAW